MVSRVYIACKTCAGKITLRIAILGNPNPIYSFSCPYCGEMIQYGLHIDSKNIVIKGECRENCENIEPNEDSKFLNLMGETALSKENHDDEIFFPMHGFLSTFGEFSAISIHTQEKLIKNWEILKRAWSLSIKGNEKLSKELRMKYDYFYEPDAENDLESEIYDFSLFFLSKGTWTNIENVYKQFPDLIRNYPQKVERLCRFTDQQLRTKIARGLLDIYDQYINQYDSFFPHMLFMKYEKSIPNDSLSSSFDFAGCKYFYGDCYEVLADAYSIIAGINNMLANRDYDKFEKMDMEKYLIIDKANKHACFENNEVLKFLCAEYNNSYRNASHHGNMYLDEKSENILYEYGKPLIKHEMSILEYIKACNAIFIEIIATNCIVLFLNQIFLNARYSSK